MILNDLETHFSISASLKLRPYGTREIRLLLLLLLLVHQHKAAGVETKQK